MRRFFAILLIVACAVKAFPAEHPAHRHAEDLVDTATATAWNAGAEAVQAARRALREGDRREQGEASEEGPSGWEKLSGTGETPQAGRAALTDRLSARVDRRADRVVQNTPASAEHSVETLAAYLKRHAGPTMRGRTRAAFRWVADHIAYDVARWKEENVTLDSQLPDVVLQSRKAVCAGYARLFVKLAKEMGLGAKRISGDADPVGIAGLLTGSSHAWTAVRLADGWYLLDPTWAAGHVGDHRFESEWDEEWWLVPPQRFERTHHPDDERWALGATVAPR